MRYQYKLEGRMLQLRPQSSHPFSVNIDELITSIATRDVSLRKIAAEMGLSDGVLSQIWIQFATVQQRADKVAQANRRKSDRQLDKCRLSQDINPDEINPDEINERRAMVDRDRVVPDARLLVREPRTYHVGI